MQWIQDNKEYLKQGLEVLKETGYPSKTSYIVIPSVQTARDLNAFLGIYLFKPAIGGEPTKNYSFLHNFNYTDVTEEDYQYCPTSIVNKAKKLKKEATANSTLPILASNDMALKAVEAYCKANKISSEDAFRMLTKFTETYSNMEYGAKYADMFSDIIKKPSDKLLKLLVKISTGIRKKSTSDMYNAWGTYKVSPYETIVNYNDNRLSVSLINLPKKRKLHIGHLKGLVWVYLAKDDKYKPYCLHYLKSNDTTKIQTELLELQQNITQLLKELK